MMGTDKAIYGNKVGSPFVPHHDHCKYCLLLLLFNREGEVL